MVNNNIKGSKLAISQKWTISSFRVKVVEGLYGGVKGQASHPGTLLPLPSLRRARPSWRQLSFPEKKC